MRWHSSIFGIQGWVGIFRPTHNKVLLNARRTFYSWQKIWCVISVLFFSDGMFSIIILFLLLHQSVQWESNYDWFHCIPKMYFMERAALKTTRPQLLLVTRTFRELIGSLPNPRVWGILLYSDNSDDLLPKYHHQVAILLFNFTKEKKKYSE